MLLSGPADWMSTNGVGDWAHAAGATINAATSPATTKPATRPIARPPDLSVRRTRLPGNGPAYGFMAR